MRGRLTRRWSVFAATTVAAILATSSPAAGQTDHPSTASDGTPPEEEAVVEQLAPVAVQPVDSVPAAEPPASPTELGIGVWVEQVLRIDERGSLFEVDATLRARWVDKRGLESCTATRVYVGSGALRALTERWAPRFVVTFGRGPRATTNLELSVDCDGNVRYEERFTVAVTQQFANLNDFPFDQHEIAFTVQPYGSAGTRAVTFVPFSSDEDGEARAVLKRAATFEAEEWDFQVVDVPAVPGPASITTRISIDRRTGYYWMNVIAPLVLIVSISWIVFWMKPVLHERLSVSITVLLTVVAFDFLTDDSLPKLAFTTRIDQFYNVSYGFVALSILASVIATGRVRWPRWLVRFLRWMSPHLEPVRKWLRPISDRFKSARLNLKSSWNRRFKRRPSESDMNDVIERASRPHGVDRGGRLLYYPLYLVAVWVALGLGWMSPGRDAAPEEVEPTVTATVPETPTTEVTLDAAEEGEILMAEGGEILEAGQSDQFRFCLNETGATFSLAMSSTTSIDEGDTESLDPYLELYRSSDGDLVASDDDGGGGVNSLIVHQAGDTCYLVIARDKRLDTGVGTYTLTLLLGEIAVGEPEAAPAYTGLQADFGVDPSEVDEEAQTVDVDQPLDAAIESAGGFGLHRVCVAAGQNLSVAMDRTSAAVNSEFDPELIVYEQADQVAEFVASDHDGGVGDRNSLVVLPEEPEEEACYLVVAADRSRQMTGKYRLTVGVVEPSPEDIAQTDDAAAMFGDVEAAFGLPIEALRELASPLDADGELVGGTITQPPGVAVYEICAQPDENTAVTASSLNDIDPFLVLYTLDGTYVAFNDDAPAEGEVSARRGGSRLPLPPGERCFLVVVADESGVQTGSFSIRAEATPIEP